MTLSDRPVPLCRNWFYIRKKDTFQIRFIYGDVNGCNATLSDRPVPLFKNWFHIRQKDTSQIRFIFGDINGCNATLPYRPETLFKNRLCLLLARNHMHLIILIL